MDEQLEKKIAEAKAAGYTDEEIRNYLSPPQITTAPENNPNRHESLLGTAEFGGAHLLNQGLKYAGEGALGYGAYRGIRNLINQYRGTPGVGTGMPNTAAPTTPPVANQFTSNPPARIQISPEGRTMSNLSNPNLMPAQEAPPVNPQIQPQSVPTQNSPSMADRFGQIAQQYAPIIQKYAPYAARAGALVTGLTTSPELNQGEEAALRRIHEAQDQSKQINDRVKQAALNRVQGQ